LQNEVPRLLPKKTIHRKHNLRGEAVFLMKRKENHLGGKAAGRTGGDRPSFEGEKSHVTIEKGGHLPALSKNTVV